MIVVLLACADPNPDPAEAKLGERLFVEPRFAQRFAAEAGDALNSPLAEGDPVLDVEVRDGGDVPGPFAGSTMSCRQCHLVDDVTANVGASVRTYADFARRSPIPDRGDGLHETVRNSPSLVDMSIARDTPFLLHFDGEFDSPAALVRGTFTGRNLGWLADEHGAAVAHVAAVVRADDGTFPVYTEGATIPYATLLAGTDPDIPAALRIPEELRVDVDSATDEEVLDAVAALVGAYLENIQFSRGLESGLHDGSPYDAFLVANDLPRAPTDGETVEAYTTRLRDAVGALGDPVWISEVDGMLALHDHPFQFGEAELRGLRTFLATPGNTVGSVGNCASCHAPPVFSDFGLHNTGVSQREYDAIWGEGAFVALVIPDLDTRAADPAPWLPASPAHPDWRGAMKAVPSADDPGLADLGAWSIYANDDHPDVQDSLTTLLDGDTDATRLDSAVAAFKTPSVRDLGQSAPYLHDGGAASLDEVIEHYRVVSNLARAGTLRNADPELAGITLTDADAADLRAFLQALDEDYD